MDSTKFPLSLLATEVPVPAKKTNYPAQFASLVQGRIKRRLGEAFGLSGFGVNLVCLLPGALSSVKHWHTHEDEFVYVLSGSIVLTTGTESKVLCAGECAGFAAGVPAGHHLRNETMQEAWYLEVGSRVEGDQAHYPDDDLAVKRSQGKYDFRRKDGTPYASNE
jgi:uncharacterized cupin superfamily protein